MDFLLTSNCTIHVFFLVTFRLLLSILYDTPLHFTEKRLQRGCIPFKFTVFLSPAFS